MRRLILVALVLAHAPRGARAQAGTETWTIDPSHTAAQFAVRHLLVSTVRGQFDRVSGTIRIAGNDLRTLSVQVTIDAASVNTRVALRDADLRSANFFHVEKHPTITFTSKRVEVADGEGRQARIKLVGDLTMHGVTREVALDVAEPSLPLAAGRLLRIGASATTIINRHDFGLNYGRMVEGAAIVGDEITITIDVEATRATGGTSGGSAPGSLR